MPVTYAFDGRIVVLRLSGEYSTGDLRTAIDQSLTDRGRPELTGMLFDLSESTAIEERDAADVEGMARFLANRGPRFGRRLAMVAPTDLSYGLMRMGGVTAQAQGVEAAVFRDVASARVWLDADDGKRPG